MTLDASCIVKADVKLVVDCIEIRRCIAPIFSYKKLVDSPQKIDRCHQFPMSVFRTHFYRF